jgi:fructan beta-fructosidase
MRKALFIINLTIVHLYLCAQTATYKERFRPQFHFSPALNWTNDPNGLVYYDGEYHIFYQSNPYENKWGHMTWAHAISKDLVHWQHLPLAIKEEKGIMIFSGTCVVDKNNTIGFGKNGAIPMVAIYTGHTDNNQSQCLAYSFDKGRTWKKYAQNPILDLHKKDFRDPKVFWYAPKQYWVMAVVLPLEHKVQFYRSQNLLQWSLLSEFGPAGDLNGVWECPDLFQVPVANEINKKKWVLTNSISTTMQYFVGEFDGVSFHNENPAGVILRPDEGPDFYAAISYNQLPAAQKPVMVGWANNWQYANDIPTTPWKGAMALPRELSLKKDGGTWKLAQKPADNIEKLKNELLVDESVLVSDEKVYDTTGTQLEIEADIQPSQGKSGVQLAVGDGHYVEIGYNSVTQKMYTDRAHCAGQSFNKNFDKLSYFETPVTLKDNRLLLHIYFDNSIVEVFANNGETVMTMQVFPGENDKSVALFSNGGTAKFNNIKIWRMKSAWE